MTLRRCRILIVLAAACLAGAACATVPARPAPTADPLAPLAEEEVSVARIKTFFDAAFLEAEIDPDGDLKISDGGMKTFLHVDPERTMITIFALWELKAGADETSKLRFANAANDDLVLVRFAVHDPTTLWCDYQLRYEGGITPSAIVGSYRLFATVVRDAVNRKDPEGVVGSD